MQAKSDMQRAAPERRSKYKEMSQALIAIRADLYDPLSEVPTLLCAPYAEQAATMICSGIASAPRSCAYICGAECDKARPAARFVWLP